MWSQLCKMCSDVDRVCERSEVSECLGTLHFRRRGTTAEGSYKKHALQGFIHANVCNVRL